MVVTTEYMDIALPGSPMRTFVAAPKAEGRYPGIWCYSDIFSSLRRRYAPAFDWPDTDSLSPLRKFIAGSSRREQLSRSMTPDDSRGAKRFEDSVTHFDADVRSGLDWLSRHPKVAAGKIGAVGFCIGGDLAFRAAFQPEVRATVCYYATGIHDGKLGQDADAGTLARAKEIRGEILMIFGTKDPHVPDAGRETIDRGCAGPVQSIRRCYIQPNTRSLAMRDPLRS